MEARESMFQGKAPLLRAAVLGASAWMTLVLVPELVFTPHAPESALSILMAVVPVLLLGAMFIPWVQRSRALPWLALVTFPTGLVLRVAMRGVSPPDAVDETVLLLAGVIAWLAYGAAALSSFAFPAKARTSTLRRQDYDKLDSPQRWRRMVIMGMGAVFALVATVLVPTWGGIDAYADAWGAAAKEARILAVIFGGAASTLALGMVMGPALRLRKVAVPKGTAERNAALYLSLATLTMLMLMVYLRSK